MIEKSFPCQELSKALETRKLILLLILSIFWKGLYLKEKSQFEFFFSCQCNLNHHTCSPYCAIKNACHSKTIKEKWNEVSLYSYPSSLFQEIETSHLCEISYLNRNTLAIQKGVYTLLQGSKETGFYPLFCKTIPFQMNAEQPPTIWICITTIHQIYWVSGKP